RAYLNQVVVTRRPMESCRQVGDSKTDAGAFDVGIAHPSRADEVRAPDLAPDQIIGVIDDTHLVRFGVAHAKLDVVRWQRPRPSRVPGRRHGAGRRGSFVTSRRSSGMVCL